MSSSNENDKRLQKLTAELREKQLIQQELVEAAKTAIELSKMLIAQSKNLCQVYHQIYVQTLSIREFISAEKHSITG